MLAISLQECQRLSEISEPIEGRIKISALCVARPTRLGALTLVQIIDEPERLLASLQRRPELRCWAFHLPITRRFHISCAASPESTTFMSGVSVKQPRGVSLQRAASEFTRSN